MDNYKTVSKLLFPENLDLNKTPTQRFEDQLRNQLYSMRNERLRILNPENPQQITDNENYTEIAEFIKNISLRSAKNRL